MDAHARNISPDLDSQYEILVRSHRAALERLARRLARDPEDAEDLLQETLLDAYRAFPRFRPDSHFYSWVGRIMTNNHLDRLRRKRHPQVSLDGEAVADGETLDLPDHSADPARVLLRDELDGPLRSALESLQPVHRATVELCDLNGATYEEAARAEACPVGTIRSRLHRAHKALRQLLGSVEPVPLPAAPAPTASRRRFLLGSVAAAGIAVAQLNGSEEAGAEPRSVRVHLRVDGAASSARYPEGLARAVASALEADRGIQVTVSAADGPSQGLEDAALEAADVLVWWSGEGASEVPPDRVAAVVRQVRDRGMGLIVLNAGAGCEPFRRILGEEARQDTPAPPEAMPVDVRITAPRHPVVRGVSPFHLAAGCAPAADLEGVRPDVVVLDGTPASGGAPAWQGMVWRKGRGRIFYFRPGRADTPVFLHEEVRCVLRNAVHWCSRS